MQVYFTGIEQQDVVGMEMTLEQDPMGTHTSFLILLLTDSMTWDQESHVSSFDTILYLYSKGSD